MNLDAQLRDALHDDRLALPVPAGTLDAVRRKRRTRQALAVTGTAVCAVALVGGVLLLAPSSSGTSRVLPYASAGVAPGSPVPGISPAFVPTSGRDWLMDDAQWQAYSRAHTHPSPGPGQSTVESPAPLGPQSEHLLAEVRAAGLPEGTTFTRDDSTGGQPGAAAVTATLPDGMRVYVNEIQLQEPESYEMMVGPGRSELFDVPGTDSVGVLFAMQGPGVLVVSRGGICTQWNDSAQTAASRAQLKTWAIAAEQAADH